MVSQPIPPIIIMGVQGSGKSTIGILVAGRLGVAFVDGDSLHSAENKALMASGHALTDDQRLPWLRDVGRQLERGEGAGIVVACSALKRSHRDLLRQHVPDLFIVYACGGLDLIYRRIVARHHEYMPPSLLQSQFDNLEERQDSEAGLTVDIAKTPEQIVDRIVAVITEGGAANED